MKWMLTPNHFCHEEECWKPSFTGLNESRMTDGVTTTVFEVVNRLTRLDELLLDRICLGWQKDRIAVLDAPLPLTNLLDGIRQSDDEADDYVRCFLERSNSEVGSRSLALVRKSFGRIELTVLVRYQGPDHQRRCPPSC